MGASNQKIENLLTQAGFRVCGRRADCARCKGNAKLTVSFNDQVAHCHRCKWSANLRQLAKGLGQDIAPETAAHRAARAKAEQFAAWIDSTHRTISTQYRQLGRKAELAKQILSRFPDCEEAWSALGKFLHEEARLSAALETLCFEKAPHWLESPSTSVGLFTEWEVQHACR